MEKEFLKGDEGGIFRVYIVGGIVGVFGFSWGDFRGIGWVF